MLPSASCRIASARTLALPTVCCVMPMHQTTVLGRFFASVSATRRTSAGLTPVTSSTRCGVHCATSLRTSSIPWTRASMNFRSSQPFSKIVRTTPQTNGMSVPGRMVTWWCALAAVRVKRGSTTIMRAPFSLACSTICIDTGCASAAFEPMNSIALVFSMSLNELVIAP